jgi:hypothetical protein
VPARDVSRPGRPRKHSASIHGGKPLRFGVRLAAFHFSRQDIGTVTLIWMPCKENDYADYADSSKLLLNPQHF